MGCAVTGEDVANNTYTATPLYEQALQWFYNNYELMHNYNIQPLFKKNKKKQQMLRRTIHVSHSN